MASRNWATKILITAAVVAAGIALASPAHAVDEPPTGGQVSTNGYTWSN
ncbi:MAG: hypothetical protein K0R62_8713 [Nonomuraea muscovyensis]|nr:hypothetical protein [Nonomuraea muscovyensis]